MSPGHRHRPFRAMVRRPGIGTLQHAEIVADQRRLRRIGQRIDMGDDEVVAGEKAERRLEDARAVNGDGPLDGEAVDRPGIERAAGKGRCPVRHADGDGRDVSPAKPDGLQHLDQIVMGRRRTDIADALALQVGERLDLRSARHDDHLIVHVAMHHRDLAEALDRGGRREHGRDLAHIADVERSPVQRLDDEARLEIAVLDAETRRLDAGDALEKLGIGIALADGGGAQQLRSPAAAFRSPQPPSSSAPAERACAQQEIAPAASAWNPPPPLPSASGSAAPGPSEKRIRLTHMKDRRADLASSDDDEQRVFLLDATSIT